MNTPSAFAKGWVNWVGAALVAVSIGFVVYALYRRGAVPLTSRASSLSAASGPAALMEKWRKDTFAGRDSRKLWEQYSQAAQAKLQEPGADPSDIKAKAGALGPDPERIFGFIRDQIGLEPYAGVLRGARGTLLSGAGNSLDRALLAQELLKFNGIDSRLVKGSLSEAQADGLLARFLVGSPPPRVLTDLVSVPTAAELNAQVASLSSKSGIAESSLAGLVQLARSQREDFWAKSDAQMALQFKFLKDHLRQGAIKSSNDGATLSERLTQRLREHYWLQIKEASGAWSEFDPTFTDSKRGTAYGSSPVPMVEIPKDSYHKLEFRLVYQSMTHGALKEEDLISATFPSEDAPFEQLEFRIQPAELGTPVAALPTMDSKQLIDLLRSIKRFRPVLRAGSEIRGGRVFDLEGNTYGTAAGPLLKVPVGGTFADALGGGGEAAPQFVELRVVLRISGPGRDPMIQTRAVVRADDLKSPAFAPPLVEWDLLLQPQWLSSEFLAFRALSQTVSVGDALLAAQTAGRAGQRLQNPPSAASVLLMQMALLRETATAHELARQKSVRALVDEPMLTISGRRLAGTRDHEGQFTAERFVDIVDNGIRYVAGDNAPEQSAYDAALRQGVADCTIEYQLSRVLFPNATNWSGATIFEQALKEQRPVLLANAQDIDNLRSVGVPEADIEWIHDNEPPSSRLVVATTAGGSDAWWSISPDGTAILRSSGGKGSDFAETVLTHAEIVGEKLLELGELGSQIMCLYEIGSAALAGMQYFASPGYRELGIDGWHVVNIVFCVGAQYVAIGTAAKAEVHGVSYATEMWNLLGIELGWHLGDQVREHLHGGAHEGATKSSGGE